MLKKISTLLLINLTFTAPTAYASCSSKLADFLTEETPAERVIKNPKSAFKAISFPGATGDLFNDLVDGIEKLKLTSVGFPYSETEMEQRWTSLFNHMKRHTSPSEEDVVAWLSYFSLMHFGQFQAELPELAKKLNRGEKDFEVTLLPTQAEVLWLFPNKLLNGLPREAFKQFLDLIFKHFASAKSHLSIETPQAEKAFHERVQNKDVLPSEIKFSGWPRHSPQGIIVGWFCLYDRLMGAYDSYERKRSSLKETTSLEQTASDDEQTTGTFTSLLASVPSIAGDDALENTALIDASMSEIPHVSSPIAGTSTPQPTYSNALAKLKEELETSLLYELSLTINLHGFIRKEMDSHFQEVLPKFMCSACRETAIALNGIQESNK
ncbi:MAG: hypothetical protein ACTHJ4_01310 [Candidatus Nucleicultricaceae bacterium]